MSDQKDEGQEPQERDSGRPAWKKRDAAADSGSGGDARRSDDRRGGRSERPQGGRGDRPFRDSGRPSRDGQRDGARPTRDGDRPRRDGDRPSRTPRDGERRPYGDRPTRPARDGERRPYGDRPQRDGERRSYGDRPDRPQRDGERRPYGDRPARPPRGGERRPYGDRPQRDGGRPQRDGDRPRRDGDRPFRDDRGPRREGDRGGFRSERPGRAGEGRPGADRPEWQQRVDRVRDPNRPKSPMIPEEITEKDLDLLVRVQFKTLSPENSERVARHLAMVNLLINDDPELAHQHAIAAAERAGRIAIVRETLALTAYTVGDFALALREMQAYRRISGANDQLPIMVDCERGLGRPDKALELGRSVDVKTLDPSVRANLAIAMSGARLDRGENELALAELEIPELNPERVFEYSPQLFFAYSDTLEILGRTAESKRWAKLAERAAAAIEAKNAPDHEVQDIIEEIEIPEPYESKKPRD